MVSLISTGSNYIIVIMGVIYAITCFTVFLPSTEKRQVKRMEIIHHNRQELFMFVFHFICYGVLFAKTLDTKIIFLYLAQVVFFKMLIFVYSRVYVDCSRILMNHTCFLLLIGFVMLTRLSFDKAVKQFIIAAATSLIVLFIPYFMEKAVWLKKLKWIYGLLGLIFLSSVFVIGTSQNGATNWISLGHGIALQPSEFVKISFVFFIAAMLTKAPNFKTMLLTSIFAACHVIILIGEKDLGGALIYFVVYVFLCYVATGRGIYLFGGIGAGTLAAKLAYMLFAHVRVRFIAWKDPWSVIEGSGYQITQSLFAIAAGSWLGKGLTQGRPNDIPIVESDFIFSAITEEFGILFAICLILIYLGVFIHFLKIAMDVRGRFYKLLAYGFSICFIFQVFLTIGGVTKFIPSTGVTLPLISYGGSSVASTLIIFAVMQGIFIIAYKEDDENEEEQVEDLLKTVNVYEKIKNLPLKTQTVLSKEFDKAGIYLSGGEQQKIGLARTLYRTADLVILDEPFSSMDQISANKILKEMESIYPDKMMILITHDLHDLSGMDKILVLDEGQIVEEGTEKELILKKGKFFQMWRRNHTKEDAENEQL